VLKPNYLGWGFEYRDTRLARKRTPIYPVRISAGTTLFPYGLPTSPEDNPPLLSSHVEGRCSILGPTPSRRSSSVLQHTKMQEIFVVRCVVSAARHS